MMESSGTELAAEFQTLNDHLLLRPILSEEISEDAATSHGAHARAEWGEVIGVGDHVTSPVSRGDRVAFRPASAIAIALSGRWFAMTKSSELLGIMRKEGEPEPVASAMAAAEAEREDWTEPVNREREESLDTDGGTGLARSCRADRRRSPLTGPHGAVT